MSDSTPRPGSGTPAGIRDTEGKPDNSEDKNGPPSDSSPRPGSGTHAGLRDNTEGDPNAPDDRSDTPSEVGNSAERETPDHLDDEGATPSSGRNE